MTAWWSELRAVVAVPVVVVRLVVGPAVAEVQLVAERNYTALIRAARLQVTPKIEIRAADVWLSSNSIIPRL
jgi:hypothetical protein